MTLEEQINADIKTAILAKEKSKLEALRAVKSAVLLAKTEKGSDKILDSAMEMKILQKLVKQRKEAAAIYKEQNRPDLYENEIFEAAIIETYLPEQMDDKSLKENLQAIIEDMGASTIADMGKVMGIASKKFAGQADSRKIAEMVKAILSR